MISRRLFFSFASAGGVGPGLQRAYARQSPHIAQATASTPQLTDPGKLRKLLSDLCCSP